MEKARELRQLYLNQAKQTLTQKEQQKTKKVIIEQGKFFHQEDLAITIHVLSVTQHPSRVSKSEGRNGRYNSRRGFQHCALNNKLIVETENQTLDQTDLTDAYRAFCPENTHSQACAHILQGRSRVGSPNKPQQM